MFFLLLSSAMMSMCAGVRMLAPRLRLLDPKATALGSSVTTIAVVGCSWFPDVFRTPGTGNKLRYDILIYSDILYYLY